MRQDTRKSLLYSERMEVCLQNLIHRQAVVLVSSIKTFLNIKLLIWQLTKQPHMKSMKESYSRNIKIDVVK